MRVRTVFDFVSERGDNLIQEWINGIGDETVRTDIHEVIRVFEMTRHPGPPCRNP